MNITASADREFYQRSMSIEETTPIFAALKQMKKHRVFMEVTNVIVPQVGDNMDKGIRLAERISNDLSSETPYHILQFHPYAVTELPPTPQSTLEKFVSEARSTVNKMKLNLFKSRSRTCLNKASLEQAHYNFGLEREHERFCLV